MAYEKTNWVNGETPINADNLNNMESGIASAFRFLGKELIASVEDDTTANWAALGDGIVYYETAGLLNNQPTTYGFVENIVCGNLVFQTFHAMNGKGGKWTRSGNSSGWYSGSANWVKSLDETNGIQIKKLWENASPTSSFREQDVSLGLTEYDVIGIPASGTGSTSAIQFFEKNAASNNLKLSGVDAGSGNYKQTVASRQISISDTGVHFYPAYLGSAVNDHSNINTALIPLSIYGIKGVL